MIDKLRWSDAEGIALALRETHPEVDPLTVRFTELHRWVCALENFEDDPKASNEGRLEAIQMAWHSEWQDEHEIGE